jgi:hypothetical protein
LFNLSDGFLIRPGFPDMTEFLESDNISHPENNLDNPGKQIPPAADFRQRYDYIPEADYEHGYALSHQAGRPGLYYERQPLDQHYYAQDDQEKVKAVGAQISNAVYQGKYAPNQNPDGPAFDFFQFLDISKDLLGLAE